jgi:hypothetical protein
MRLPSRVLRTSSTCVPSSTLNLADALKIVNGAHNPPTTRRKPKFMTSSPLKNVSDRHSIMKPRTSTVSPSSPADGNPLPNRLPNFATQSAICGNIRLSNFAPHWDYLMKKNCIPCTKRELPVIIAIWKLLLLIFLNFVPPTHKSKNLPHLPPPAV